MTVPVRSRLPAPAARACVLLLALFSFAMSATVSRQVFEELPHLEDEIAYLFQARMIAGGHVVIPSPEPATAFWQPFIIDRDGLRFGKYTPGYPLQLAAGVLLGQPWIINAWCALLTVPLIYRLGRELFASEDVGLIAAALAAFSPMALLLNGSLMGHSAALLWTAVFLYGCWRLERGGSRAWAWGLGAGLGLGMVFITRPATALAIAAPVIAWSTVRLLRSRTQPARLARLLAPLLLLSAVACAIALLVPWANWQATGDPTANLYRLVWDYDRPGFGEGYGRHGHTLEKGVRQMRFDLSLTAADLFGLQIPALTGADGLVRFELQDHFLNQADYYPAIGLSWLLLLGAPVVLWRRRALLLALWMALGLGWLAWPFLADAALMTPGPLQALRPSGAEPLIRTPQVGWVVVVGLMAWLAAPLLILRERRAVWAWLLAATALALIVVQISYWIGSQRYSTRYYYEGLIGAAIWAALPLAWAATRLRWQVVYALLAFGLVCSLLAYSIPRVSLLRGYNLITHELIDAIEARRQPGRQALVLVSGDEVAWRSFGELMALTSPYLDSDIVAARITPGISREAVIARFPGRQIIEMNAAQNDAWFPEDRPATPGG